MTKVKLFLFFLIGTVIFNLAGCGFHSQTIQDIPPQLRTIYLDSPNPYSPLTVQLRRTLKSINVHITQTAQAAPVTLRIISNNMTPNIPSIIYSGNATSYSYTLKTTFEIAKRNGEIIFGPKTLHISRSVLQNANQVYTPDATDLLKRELTRSMVTLIYNQITALNTWKALNKAFYRQGLNRHKHSV